MNYYNGTARRYSSLVGVILLSCIVCTSCDLDPLNRTRRRMCGDYILKEADDGSFYVMRNGSSVSGELVAVGWNRETVVFEDKDTGCLIQIIDPRYNTISSPVSREDVSDGIRGIKLMPPKAAWDSL